jgi:stage III sporulation protein AD
MLIKIIGVAFITAITAVLLKQSKPELALSITVAGIIVILLLLMDSLKDTIVIMGGLAQTSGVENGLIKILLKIVGVGYVAEFSAGILSDFGAQAIADKVILGGKIVIVIISLPIFQALLNLVSGFLGLV